MTVSFASSSAFRMISIISSAEYFCLVALMATGGSGGVGSTVTHSGSSWELVARALAGVQGVLVDNLS
jgi:hypothetical protein